MEIENKRKNIIKIEKIGKFTKFVYHDISRLCRQCLNLNYTLRGLNQLLPIANSVDNGEVQPAIHSFNNIISWSLCCTFLILYRINKNRAIISHFAYLIKTDDILIANYTKSKAALVPKENGNQIFYKKEMLSSFPMN